jgi:hypothetical protein
MILEWVKILGPILISWPVVGLIAILIFRKPLLALAHRFTGEDVQRVKFGSIELERVKGQVDLVKQRQAVQESDIEAIRVALRGILTKHEFGPLKGLNEIGKVPITKGPNLVNYLHRLDGLNFIQPNPGHGLNEIEEKPDGSMLPDLKDYFHITDEGRAYLDITTRLKIFKSGVDWTDKYPWAPLPPSRSHEAELGT